MSTISLTCWLLCNLVVSSLPVYGSSATELARKGKLYGINRSGFEHTCVQNNGITEGPIDDDAILAMKKWNINLVRIPLNEDCWLGINGHNPNYSGPKYREAVQDYVKRLRSHQLNVMLDLHWSDGRFGGAGSGCYEQTAQCQKPMPDKENAPAFWRSVATTFKNDDGIIFDMFNEPFPDMAIRDSIQAWKCLRDGGSECPGFEYEIVGMQELVNVIRSTGAKNLIMSPGLQWNGEMTHWLEYAPTDPANNLATSWHNYNTGCANQECWERMLGPIIGKYPIIVGEVGQTGCSHEYVDPIYSWFDERNVNYVGWTWNPWDCSKGPSLISDYDGTPSGYGQGLFNHLAKKVNTLTTHVKENFEVTISVTPKNTTNVGEGFEVTVKVNV